MPRCRLKLEGVAARLRELIMHGSLRLLTSTPVLMSPSTLMSLSQR